MRPVPSNGVLCDSPVLGHPVLRSSPLHGHSTHTVPIPELVPFENPIQASLAPFAVEIAVENRRLERDFESERQSARSDAEESESYSFVGENEDCAENADVLYGDVDWRYYLQYWHGALCSGTVLLYLS